MKRSKDKDMDAFGKKVAELRRKAGLTQEELATRSDLAVKTIASIEQGKRWAKLPTLHKLAHGIGVTTSDLFVGLK